MGCKHHFAQNYPVGAALDLGEKGNTLISINTKFYQG